MTRKKVTETVDTSKIDRERVKEQAAVAAALLAGVGSKAASQAGTFAGQARVRAVQAKDWAEPRVTEFVAWLTPRAEKAWYDSVQAAAPRVEKAAEKAGPLIDTAHDKIVDELLPKVVAAFNHAATQAAHSSEVRLAAGTTAAAGSAHALADALAKNAEKARSKKRGWLWALAGVGAAGAGYVFWRRAQPQNDPWAEPWEQATKPDYTGAAREAKHAVAHAAETVGERAGATVAKGREAGAKVAQTAGDLGSKAAHAAEEVRVRAAEAAAKATEAAKAAADKVNSQRTRKQNGTESAEEPTTDAEALATTIAAEAAAKPTTPKPGPRTGSGTASGTVSGTETGTAPEAAGRDADAEAAETIDGTAGQEKRGS